MSKRGANILVGTGALLTGGAIYAIFREDSYVAAIANYYLCVSPVRSLPRHIAWDLVRYYLPDFLWGVALGCGLQAIHNPGRNGVYLCALGVFACGTVWEVLQYMDAVSGTGDLWDIFAYLLAAFFTILINLKERVT